MNTTQRILLLAKEKGIKQKYIEDLIGATYRGKVTEWKSGKSTPTEQELQTLANFFNVSTDYLLGKTDNKKSPTTQPSDEALGLQDPLTSEIISTFSQLSPDGKDYALAQLRALVELEAKKET